MTEAYEGQFKPVTIPIRGTGLEAFKRWYRLVVEGAFNSGIKTGY